MLSVIARTGALVVAVALGLALAGCSDGDAQSAGEGGAGQASAVSPLDGEPRSASDAEALTPLIVAPVGPAVPFAGSNGRTIVTYELRLHNVTPLTLTPTRVEIADGDGDAIETLSRRAIAAGLALPGARSGVRRLTEGQVATLYVTLDFDGPADVPARLAHTVTVTAPELPDGGVPGEPPAVVDVDRDFEAPVLGPPIEPGRRYIAADSCCDSERHRRALLAIGAREWLAQRFAVDWEQLDAGGRTVRKGGDPSDPADYAVYGRRAIAATDATVVHVVDGLEDQEPGSLPDGIALSEADGNSVVADIGGGLYMLYAHLQPGSLEVAKGDRIGRGDPIGLVGNSGNSSAPHLHFHVMDGPSALTSEGVPYVIDSFATTGRVVSTKAFDALENTTRRMPVESLSSDGRHERELPLDLTLVDFD